MSAANAVAAILVIGLTMYAVFGGADLQTLYVTASDKVYRRHLRRKGVFPWTPVKLPAPRL